MKKITILVMMLLLVSCVSKKEEEEIITPQAEEEITLADLEKLTVFLNKNFSSLYVKWDEITDSDLIYKVRVLDTEGKTLAETLENYNSMNGLDLLAYGAQENEYYDAACFKVEAMKRGSEDVLLEGQSEEVMISDFFPKEKEVGLKDKKITSFSYSARRSGMVYGMYFGELQSFDLNIDEDKVSCYGSYVKGDKLKEFEKTLKKEELEKLLALIEGGKLVRRSLRDPQLIVMDEDTPERITLSYEGMEDMYSRWYEFEPADRDALLNLLLEIAK